MKKEYSVVSKIFESRTKIYFEKDFLDLVAKLFQNSDDLSKEKKVTIDKSISNEPLNRALIFLFFEFHINLEQLLLSVSELRDKKLCEQLFLFSCAIGINQNGQLWERSNDFSRKRNCESYLLANLLGVNYFDNPHFVIVSYYTKNFIHLVSICEVFRRENKNIGEILLPLLIESFELAPFHIETFYELNDEELMKNTRIEKDKKYHENHMRIIFYLLLTFCEKRHVAKFIKEYPDIINEKNISVFPIEHVYKAKNFEVLIYLKETIPVVKRKMNLVLRRITKRSVCKSHIPYHLDFLQACAENKRKKIFEMFRENKGNLTEFKYCAVAEALRNGHIDLVKKFIEIIKKKSSRDVVNTILDNDTFLKYINDSTIEKVLAIFERNQSMKR